MASCCSVQNTIKNEVCINWSIKGYHMFKIKPPQNIPLTVMREDHNSYDLNAIKVMVPMNLEDKYKSKEAEGILGRQIGRVPANLCKVFRKILSEDTLIEPIKCFGRNARHAADIHVHQKFKRSRSKFGRDVPGGGAENSCLYVFRVKETKLASVKQIMEEHLSKHEMDKVLF
eukprot:gene929-236_t